MVIRGFGRGLCGAILSLVVLATPRGGLDGQDSAEGLSLLTRLDTTGRVLEAGVTRSGTLGESDLLLPGGERLQGWSFEAAGGEWVQVDLASDDFDAYLYLAGEGLGPGLSDDDSGGDLNSRICAQLPEAGRYTIAASSLGQGTGTYTITLARLSAPAESGCVGGGMAGEGVTRLLEEVEVSGVLLADVEVTGLLDPFDPRHPERGGPVDLWEYHATEGERIAFDLASDDLDTYLYLLGPDYEEVGADDDSGTGCTGSRLWITFPSSGSYRVIATSYSEGAEGAYRLTATATPVEDLECEWEGGSPPSDIDMTGIEILPGRTLTRADFSAEPGGPVPTGRSVLSGVELNGVLSESDLPLEEGGVGQGWAVEALEGETFRIELESSDFDPYLVVSAAGSDEVLWSDDDGGQLNSRLDVGASEDGEIRILVRTATGEGTGSFTLRVVRISGGR